MATVRTAISLDAELLREVNELAQQMNIPRSEVFARAAEHYVRKQESRRLLDRINSVYAGEPNSDDLDLAAHMKALRRRLATEGNRLSVVTASGCCARRRVGRA